MRLSCLINNYNYQDYVTQAIDSALDQLLPFDEVIAVDDGSTDHSPALMSQRYAGDPRFRLIPKVNGGQLSAVNEGFRHATGDVIFFLDADDLYHPDHTKQAVHAYRHMGADFVVAGHREIGPGAPGNDALPTHRPPRCLGYSVYRTLRCESYIGGPMSTLSMRRSIAEQILPYPLTEDWRIRADDVLTLGASLVGARKQLLGGVQVDYRIHGKNHYSGVRRASDVAYRHGLARNRLVTWYTKQQRYDIDRLAMQMHREFLSIERPSRKELSVYLMLNLRSRLSTRLRMRQLSKMAYHYLSGGGPRTVLAEAPENADTPTLEPRRAA